MDKMREALIKFGQDNPVLELDFRLHTHGQYLTQDKAIVASRAFKAGAEWQAAQAASVPAAELEALRKDAERYRRLRRMDWFDGPLCVVRDPQIKGRVGLGSDCPSGTRLDDAIDAAIAGEK